MMRYGVTDERAAWGTTVAASAAVEVGYGSERGTGASRGARVERALRKELAASGTSPQAAQR
jgi:hypothetical protein